MKEISFKQKENLKKMRNGGHSYKEISRKLKISKSTSYKYCKNVKISDIGIRRLNGKITKNRQNFIRNFATARNIKKPKGINLNLIRILSHCLFDGCVKNDGVIYTNASVELIKEFKEDMKEVFGIPPSLIKETGNITPYWLVYYNYKRVSDFLKEFCLSYSTSSSQASIPSFLFERDNIMIAEYLRCFWDDEGSIKSNGDVTGKTKSDRVANQLVKLHSKIGINVKKYFDTKNLAYEIYVCRGQNLKNFKNIVGFKYGLVCRGRFKGLNKLTVLSKITK